MEIYQFHPNSIQHDQVIHFGFQYIDSIYHLQIPILHELYAIFTITETTLTVDVYEEEELYLPFYAKHATGIYVSEIKQFIEDTKQLIIERCFIKNDLKESILNYGHDELNLEISTPFGKESHITLVNEKKKWVAILMYIPLSYLGIESNEKCWVINLKADPVLIQSTIDYKHFFPAWHMNKKYWMSILLDHQITLDEITPWLIKSKDLVK